MAEVGVVWGSVSRRLKMTLGDAAWNTWFGSIEPVELDDTQIVLRAPSAIARERIHSRYMTILEDLIEEELGAEISVTLCQPTASSLSQVSQRQFEALDKPTRLRAAPLFETPNTQGGYQKSDRSSAFDSRYRFDAFVIGASNRFAHAAALSVAEAPSGSYNPLFIHGEAGLGKTHLLNAIGNYVRDQYPDLYVKYISTEALLNEFVDAIRKNKTSEFKARYRECDVLLIDDIQFLEGKESFQEEFFHTFNSLYGARKQIVLTSDRPPRAMSTLEERLRSRFIMGLITDIQPPDIETRMAIVRKKAEDHSLAIPTDVIAFISESIRDNIRELEGALTRVSAYSRLTHAPITLDMASSVLCDLISVSAPRRRISTREIIRVVAEFYSLSQSDLVGESRKRPIAVARQVAMYLVREMTELSYPGIGKEFGGRDHTTVMHGVEKIGSLMQSSLDLYDQVNELTHLLKGGIVPSTTVA